jgi:hypothetical protein
MNWLTQVAIAEVRWSIGSGLVGGSGIGTPRFGTGTDIRSTPTRNLHSEN